MNELTTIPLNYSQICDEISYCLGSEDKHETKRKIRDLVKQIHLLQKEDNGNFQKLTDLNIEGLGSKLKEISPRLAWKFSKAVPNYPRKDLLLTLLSTNFTENKLFQKSCKVINATVNREQKETAIEFLIDFLLKRENNKSISIRLIVDIQKIVNYKFLSTSQERLYVKIYELSKLLPREANESGIKTSEKKTGEIKMLEFPTLLEIKKMISACNDLVEDLKVIISNFKKYLSKNYIDKTLLVFIGSIKNEIIKKEFFTELLRTCKQSKNIEARILYFELLKVAGKKFPSFNFITATLHIIEKLPEKKEKEKYLLELFKTINWLQQDYDYFVKNIFDDCKDNFIMQEVFQEYIASRVLFHDLCKIVRNAHPKLVADVEAKMGDEYQGGCMEVLHEFIKKLLILAGKDDSNCDIYTKNDLGRGMIVRIVSSFVNMQLETKKMDSGKETLNELVQAYASGGLTPEDFEDCLRSTTIAIDTSLLDKIFLIKNEELKMAALYILHSMLADTYIPEKEFYDSIDSKRLTEDFYAGLLD